MILILSEGKFLMKTYTIKNRGFSPSSLASKALIIILWIVLSRIIDNEIILPTISSTLEALVKVIKKPEFINILGHSILRSLIGFIISLVIAIVIGILSKFSKFVHDLMVPVVRFLSTTPTIAIIILALIWFSNEIVPLIVGFIMVFPVLYETVLKSIINVDNKILEMAEVYNVNRFNIVKEIYLPSIFISLGNILSSSIGINLKMVIAGEVLSQPKYAIGSNLQIQKMYLNTPGVFAWIIIILVISKMFEYLMKGLVLCIKSRTYLNSLES